MDRPLGWLRIEGLAGSAVLPHELALIWAAHVGFDRALGYGLKAAVGFHETHLGQIGRPREHARAVRKQPAGVQR